MPEKKRGIFKAAIEIPFSYVPALKEKRRNQGWDQKVESFFFLKKSFQEGQKRINLHSSHPPPSGEGEKSRDLAR